MKIPVAQISVREKLEFMLSVYREKLKSASEKPIRHEACIRYEAKIELLETLLYFINTGEIRYFY